LEFGVGSLEFDHQSFNFSLRFSIFRASETLRYPCV
jgi:hypothetical protein